MKIKATVSIGYTDYNFNSDVITATVFAEHAAKYCEDHGIATVNITYIRDEEDSDNEHNKNA